MNMIGDDFKSRIRSNLGCAVIIAGSGSDDKVKPGEKQSHIEKIASSLEAFEIPYEVRISSAHKQPGRTIKMIKEYDDVGGSVTYITVAGGTDALSGTASYHALSGPVISCPPDAPNESCLNNPPGSCNAYVPNPKNVGKLVAQTYAGINPRFRQLLIKANEEKIKSLEDADIMITDKYASRQRG